MVSMKTAHTRRAMMMIRLAVVAFVLAAFSAIGSAQTGRLKGKVVDASNKPVEGATVTIESQEMNRKLTTKTDRRGEYTHFLAPGPYKVTVTKDTLSQTQETRVSIDEKELNFTLTAGGGGGGGAAAADAKKVEAENAAIKAAFTAGATALNDNKPDEAIAKFNEVIAKLPNCAECYNGIGNAYMKKKEFEQAEGAYKKAVGINANSAEGYMGLANAYSAQRKSDLAMEASAAAQKLLGTSGTAGAAGGGGASAGAIFNQGVIAWNASKIPEAQKLFEQAVSLDPKLADAHYWLGMANVNQGKLPEAAKSFEEYLKLDPKGQYAEQAKGILSQIKK